MPTELHGFSAERLARLTDHFSKYVDDRRLAGWHLRLSRHGDVIHDVRVGHANRESAAPVSDDTIWRIYSMTKPITSVAAMMLWEEGAFELRDPVSRFIPEFAQQKVWRSGSFSAPAFEPVAQPMELWHLLTHTSGLTYGFMMSHPVDAMYRAAGFEWGVPPVDLAELCRRLAALPLLFQPGSEWNYSTSIDVLGRVIEVASGESLDTFLRRRIFEPLGMVDTGFFAPESAHSRVAALYGMAPGSRGAVRLEAAEAGALQPPFAFQGGGGLVSTMDDYSRFADMLRRGGVTADGARLLAPGTVRYMASNHLPGNVDLSAFGRPLFSETTFDGVGFGLLGSVTLDPIKAKVPGSIGEFGWGGAASTFFWIDPVLDLTCVFMTQLLPSGAHPLRSQLKQMVHQALVG